VTERAVLLEPRTSRSARLRAVFAEHAPLQLAALRRAVSSGSHAEIGRAAHRLKGGARSFGAARLGDAAEAIERMARAGSLPGEESVAELGEILGATLAELAALPAPNSA
jgi:HPt (histidine-containing phosphotransfer) domain-containing protein